MERKYLFLNNDISVLLSHKQRIKLKKTPESDDELNIIRQKAESIIQNPAENIDVECIIKRSIRYSATDEYFLALFIEGKDSEQLSNLQTIEHVATMTLLPEAILMAGDILLKRKNYFSWTAILKSLHYVPLQKAFCYSLRQHEDFCEVLKVLDTNGLDYPQTFLWTFWNHWFEWFAQVGGKLLTYNDKNGLYEKNKEAKALIKEAKLIKAEWDKEMPVMIHETMLGFALNLQPEKMLVWATKKLLRNDALSNPYSANYNHCLESVWEELSGMTTLSIMFKEDLNLNLLVLMAEKAVREDDADFGLKVYDRLVCCLMNENFSNIEKKSPIDTHRQTIIAKLLVTITPTLVFTPYINNVATRFQGWNLDYHQVYNEARREAYLFCALFRIFENETFDEKILVSIWKDLLDIYLREYKRCENEYITRDEFSAPFRVAIEIAEKMNNNNCREYLHEIILENVLNIVSLLTIFSECDVLLSGHIAKKMLQRVDIEWPSAKILMEARGQKLMEKRFDSMISQVRESFK